MTGTGPASGYLVTGHPFDRRGSGSRQVVVLQGLTFDCRPMGRWAGFTLGAYESLERDHTITLVNRRPGVAAGTTIAELASDAAAMIRSTFDGPVVLVGTSTGGSIALQVAIDHPDVVRRLVVHSAAHTLGPEGRRVQREAAERARRGNWWGVASLMMAWARPPRGLAHVVFPLVAPIGTLALAAGHPKDPSDFIALVEAEDAFDCLDGLGRIRVPTLVAAGMEDPGYTPQLFRDTAAGISDAQLALYEGMGHPASGPQFRADLARFIRSDAQDAS
jgi:pimeloyl-ACP methyl ester carboxylesterase